MPSTLLFMSGSTLTLITLVGPVHLSKHSEYATTACYIECVVMYMHTVYLQHRFQFTLELLRTSFGAYIVEVTSLTIL